VAGTIYRTLHIVQLVSALKLSCPNVIKTYLSFGFISSGEEQLRPKCIVCDEKLATQAMVPSELESHLHTKHSHLCEKPTEYFKRLIVDQTRQAQKWT
jgi:hypothetical protein